MVNLHVLHGLSFAGAEAFLLEEGYGQEVAIERRAVEDGRLFLYPYTLYDEQGSLIDRIFHAEYCRRDEDGEWEAYSCSWTRDLSCTGY
ncbi:hypothetical protein DCC85_05330 [Paenibacillus sp. CAA11]|uniref:hypothetical protein n=1 Tax=Paenibacillus sp. CAA11 TaxID=1532905 RepID=UPI000D33758F|nr:hypothetical protein [Paenibacillus sp. CAA11]AWB43696.1 hypothetical protein DCC85_05330 [Paenibacillus sp. CAA11]